MNASLSHNLALWIHTFLNPSVVSGMPAVFRHTLYCVLSTIPRVYLCLEASKFYLAYFPLDYLAVNPPFLDLTRGLNAIQGLVSSRSS